MAEEETKEPGTSANTETNQEIPAGKVKDEKGRLVFAPGVSGNPAGKPKGTKHWSTLIGDMLKRKMQMKIEGKLVTLTMEEAMVESMLRQAILKGDVKAFEALTNRHEGKPHQSIEMELTEPPVPIMPLKKKP